MAQQPYDPNASVAPSDQGTSPEQVSINPGAFGAGIGQAEQNLSGTAKEASQQTFQTAVQQQGMINETLANNADLDFATKAGDLTAKFRTLQGLDAASAYPKYQADITALHNQIGSTVGSPMAQQAYNTLSTRRVALALSDASDYTAQQIKQAHATSFSDLVTNSVGQAGDPIVAPNDTQFGVQLGNITHGIVSMLQTQGYGQGMNQDPQTGKVSFTNDGAGKMAENAYTRMNETAVGQAWTNRINTLATDNVMTANKVFQDNQANIPPVARAKIAAELQPKVQDAQTRFSADTTLSNWDNKYQAQFTGGSQPSSTPGAPGTGVNNIGNIKPASAARSGALSFNDYATPQDGVAATVNNLRSGYTGLTIQQIADKWTGEPGTKANNWAQTVSQSVGLQPNAVPNLDVPAVLSALTKGIGTAEQSQANRAKFTPDVIDQGVQQALGGQAAQTASAVPPATPTSQPAQPANTPILSKADFYRNNYAQILDEARTQAAHDHPDNPRYIDSVVSRTEQRINQVISQQTLQQKSDNDLVMQAFNGDLTQGKRPTSVDQMLGSSPDVKTAWQRMQVDNPIAASNIENRIITANSKEYGNDAKTYGQGFYDLFRAVHAPATDPARITDPTQLYTHVGQDLTVSGLDKLTSEINGRATPDGEAESEMKKQFFANAKGQISGTDEGLHMKDPKGDELYLKFMAQALPMYDAGKKAGKTPTQLLNPDSPDYIGKTISGFRRPMSQWTSDIINADVPSASKNQPVAPQIGEMRQGYRFKGGNPGDPKSWELANSSGATVAAPLVH